MNIGWGKALRTRYSKTVAWYPSALLDERTAGPASYVVRSPLHLTQWVVLSLGNSIVNMMAGWPLLLAGKVVLFMWGNLYVQFEDFHDSAEVLYRCQTEVQIYRSSNAWMIRRMHGIGQRWRYIWVFRVRWVQDYWLTGKELVYLLVILGKGAAEVLRG